MVTAAGPTTPRRGLGLWICTALVIGNMVGSGIFLLPSALAAYGGISLVGWACTAAGAMLLAVVFASLSRSEPGAGGPYAYARQGFGDFAGFTVAWGYWISICCGNAAIAIALVGYLGVFWPSLTEHPEAAGAVALANVWLLTAVNVAGVRRAGIVQLATTILKLTPLVAIGVLGLWYVQPNHFTPFNVSEESTGSAITSTAALTLWAFLGLEAATIPTSNIENPRRTVPRATLLGTLIVAVVYILGTVVVMGVLPTASLAQSTAPFADAATAMWGGWAGTAIAAGAVVSCFGALNGWILLQGQLPLAVAQDGLFPASFKRLSQRGTPTFGIVVSSVFVTLLLAMNYTAGLVEQFKDAILLATLATLVPYVISAMAQAKILAKNGHRSSGRVRLAMALVTLGALLYSLWATVGIGWDTIRWGCALFAAGVPVFLWAKLRGAGNRTRPAS